MVQSTVRPLSTPASDLRGFAARSLSRMYRPGNQVFAYRLRRVDGVDVLEGTSDRYTAIVLIGLVGEDPALVEDVLHGQGLMAVSGAMAYRVSTSTELGEVALAAWAGRLLNCPQTGLSLGRMAQLVGDGDDCDSVILAWCVTALSVESEIPADTELRDRLARKLMAVYVQGSRLFPHRTTPLGSGLRDHVSCFADWVYPVQALSYYHGATKDVGARRIVQECAAHMCTLQGESGQWWWHYDVRTGEMVEGYPVYSVHQDSMGPMALFAAEDHCGGDYSEAVARSMAWLYDSPEDVDSLLDRRDDVVWRKVARREPNKLSRGIQAAATRVHSGLRMPGLDTLLPPVNIDYETRPYHMGWILHCWPPHRVSQFDR